LDTIGIFLRIFFPLGNKGRHVISTKDFLGEDPPYLQHVEEKVDVAKFRL
jgi:hypothetical protein